MAAWTVNCRPGGSEFCAGPLRLHHALDLPTVVPRRAIQVVRADQAVV